MYEAIVGLIVIVELVGMNAGSSNSPIVASVRNLRVFGILMIFVERCHVCSIYHGRRNLPLCF